MPLADVVSFGRDRQCRRARGPTRWLGVLVTLLGALVINPAATAHYAQGIAYQAVAATNRARGFLARFIPALRRDTQVHAVTAHATPNFGFTATARGITGWSELASADEKLRMLDERTRRLHDEVGELQSDLRSTE